MNVFVRYPRTLLACALTLAASGCQGDVSATDSPPPGGAADPGASNGDRNGDPSKPNDDGTRAGNDDEPGRSGGKPGRSGGEPNSGNGDGVPSTPVEVPVDRCTTDERLAAAPMPARVRRLTRLEIKNTLADLLGPDYAALAETIEQDARSTSFSTSADRSITAGYADALQTVARAAGQRYSEELASSAALDASCAASDEAAQACAKEHVLKLGARAFRRPLRDGEVEALMAVYAAGSDTSLDATPDGRLQTGLGWVVEALLQAPDFVFRTELGREGAAAGETVTLTGLELASALSYDLLASPPDQALLDAAAAGELDDPSNRLAHAERLMSERPERLREQLARFVFEWLHIDFDAPSWQKDPSAFPEFDPAMHAAIRSQTEQFVARWIDGGASLLDLLTTPDGFVDALTAPLYGVDAPSSQATLMSLPEQRAGILTQPGFLGTHAQADAASPVLRGVAIMSALLCQTPPPVPADIPPLAPVAEAAGSTNRDRFAAHTESPSCQGCHSQFDPMGFTFENYDAIGGYVLEQNGAPIDSSGALVVNGAEPIPVPDALELATELSLSSAVHECFSKQLFRSVLGRYETEHDACSLRDALDTFQGGGFDVRKLLTAIIGSEAYATRIISAE